MRGRAPIWLGAAIAAVACALAAPTLSSAAVGDLTFGECISGNEANGGSCELIPKAAAGGEGSGLRGPASTVTSPDGRFLYATAAADDAIATFSRNVETGKLTYLGCLSGTAETGLSGSNACVMIPSRQPLGDHSGLHGVRGIVLGPGGKWLYASALDDDSVATFSRNTTSGKLTYVGCVSGDATTGPGGTNACKLTSGASPDGADSGLDGPFALTMSPDLSSLYVATIDDSSLARFAVSATTGALTYQGCLAAELPATTDGGGPCLGIGGTTLDGTGSGLAFPYDLIATSDGSSLYAVSPLDSSVAAFKRNTTTGALTYQGCISGDSDLAGTCETLPEATSGATGSGLGVGTSLSSTPEGTAVYATGALDASVARFERNPTTGALSFVGCISGSRATGPAGSGACSLIPSATADGADSGLFLADGLTASPDGASIYVDSQGQATIATFAPSAGAGLEYRGCLTGRTMTGPAPGGSGACSAVPTITSEDVGSGLTAPGPAANTLEVSPDGSDLYVAAGFDYAVTRLSRELADTTPPELTLKGRRKQKGSKLVKVKVSCDEACTAVAAGKVKTGKKRSKLKGKKKALAAGAKATLKLKLPKKARKRTKKLQRRGKVAKATVKVTATDAAENESKAKLKVKLKGKKRPKRR